GDRDRGGEDDGAAAPGDFRAHALHPGAGRHEFRRGVLREKVVLLRERPRNEKRKTKNEKEKLLPVSFPFSFFVFLFSFRGRFRPLADSPLSCPPRTPKLSLPPHRGSRTVERFRYPLLFLDGLVAAAAAVASLLWSVNVLTPHHLALATDWIAPLGL